MKWPGSLQGRLALVLGGVLTLLWIVATTVTAVILRQEMDRVLDSALQETAQRILPLAVVDIIDREEDHRTQRLAALRAHTEFLTYIVRDADGHVVLQSHAADPGIFPAWAGPGFAQSATHRFYSEATLRGTVRITVAEPLDHRAAALRRIGMSLGLPLLVMIPVTLLAVVLAVRAGTAPLWRFRRALAARSARDLSPVPATGLPSEIAPLAAALDRLLERLRSAFEAERSFAANAAHELRTPLAGAIAQAQRLRSETVDPAAGARAAEIETTLKRLARLAERLMQLARAEGGRLRLERSTDLGVVARIVVEDIARSAGPGRIALTLPETPLMSDLDPDVFGIVCRNLVENALRHGAGHGIVEVTLASDGQLTVANEGPVLPGEVLERLTARFERADAGSDGSGLGLAIVAAIADRIESPLVLASPRPGTSSGFQASLRLPADARPTAPRVENAGR